MKKSLFVFAGETSGDLQGERVLADLKAAAPEIELYGVAGPRMRNLGLKGPFKMEEFQFMGFTDVIKNIYPLAQKFYAIRDFILAKNPSACLFIDYPGFNLRMAKALKKKGYQGKLIHFICPTVWAWGKGRIDLMGENLDRLITIYPFEPAYFKNTSLKVDYIGNPLVESIKNFKPRPNWRELAGIPENKPLIALFPGSRSGEIDRNLKIQLEALKLCKEKLPQHKIALSIVSPKLQNQITQIVKESGLKINSDLFLVPSCFNYELMRDSSTALAKSGTITLELALFKRPTAVIYGLSRLNRFTAKYLLRLKLPHYCIVNILAEKRVFPELIEEGFSSENIAKELLSLELDLHKREILINDLDEVEKRLGFFKTGEEAAKIVLSELNEK